MPQKITIHRTIPASRRYEDDPERQADARFYASTVWRNLRAAYLRQYPLCECDDRCERPSEEVHHRQDRKARPDLALAWSNLQALTRQCHSRITRQRQLGHGDGHGLNDCQQNGSYQ
jgi:5-methylcytosine-specific restriction protein A